MSPNVALFNCSYLELHRVLSQGDISNKDTYLCSLTHKLAGSKYV